jgi:hypothetical protein
MEAKDMAHLQHPPGGSDERRQLASFGHREGERLLHEAVAARAQAVPRHREMTIRGRDQVHGLHVREGLAIVGDRARGRHARLDREGPALLGHVGHPQLDAQLGEHAQVLLAPAPQANQKDFHRRGAPVPPTSSATS